MEQNNNGQNPTKALTKIDVLKHKINEDSVQEQFKNALAENSGPFVASLIDLYAGDSNLQNCEAKSVIMEALKAAILKLPINKQLGFAYIIPYKRGNVSIPQFQIGYKGLIQLALRTGQYRTINNDVVFEGEIRTVNKLTGEFDFNGQKKSDKVVGYFAYFELLNGFSKTFFMTTENVHKHGQRYSPSYNGNGPWKTEFDAMAKKTVLRYLLSHYGFMSVEMQQALSQEDAEEKVQNEINQNANKKPFGFGAEEAEVLSEQGVDVNNNNGPGF